MGLLYLCFYYVIRSVVITTFSEPPPLSLNKHIVIEPYKVLIIVPLGIREVNNKVCLIGCMYISEARHALILSLYGSLRK
jgi:hypothetical protein